jgi:membrane associated rhomboid family serine protease
MAFLQSQPPREPFLHAPAVVLWLIAVLVAVHLAITLIPISDEALLPFAFVPARYAQGAGLLALTVPLVSHMFLHANFVHLGVNCLWLLAFGPIVARRYGSVSFLSFFILCGVAGALAYLALNWGSMIPVIGASGGISGLMAAGLRMLRWPAMPAGGRLAPLLSRPILIFTAVWFVTNLLFGITGLGFGGIGGQIAWQAHVGGYVCGLFGIDLLERLHLRRAGRIAAG